MSKTLLINTEQDKGKNEKLTYKNKKYVNNTFFDLTLNKSKIKMAGLGVFAKEFIPKDTLIGVYGGTIVEKKTGEYDADYSMELTTKLIIDGSLWPRPLTSMVNDSHGTKFTNNCEFKMNNKRGNDRRVVLFSIDDINENEELFVDYGDGYWASRMEEDEEEQEVKKDKVKKDLKKEKKVTTKKKVTSNS